MINILATMGGLTVIVIFVFVVMGLFCLIRETMHTMYIRHIIKNRFNKKPIAKCYCRDCKRWNYRNGNGYCSKFEGWCTADNWFCWDAEPKNDIKI